MHPTTTNTDTINNTTVIISQALRTLCATNSVNPHPVRGEDQRSHRFNGIPLLVLQAAARQPIVQVIR